jgi:hypothetical protein
MTQLKMKGFQGSNKWSYFRVIALLTAIQVATPVVYAQSGQAIEVAAKSSKKSQKKSVKNKKSTQTSAAQKAGVAEASQMFIDGKAAIKNQKSGKSQKTAKEQKSSNVQTSGKQNSIIASNAQGTAGSEARSSSPQINPFTGTSLNGAGVSATKIEDKDKAKDVPTFNFNWISYNKLDTAAMENVTGADREVWGWQQPMFIFNFSKDVNLTIIPQFFNSWFGNPDRVQDDKVKAAGEEPGEVQPYSLYMGNLGFSLTHKTLYKTGGFRLEGNVKYDAPTSERASLNGSYGENWDTLNLYQTLGKFDLWLMLTGRFYFQRYKTSSLLASGGPNGEKQVQNPYFRDYEILNVGYNWTPKLSTTLSMGAYNTSYYDDPNTNRPEYVKTVRVAAFDVTYNFTKKFGLSVGIFEEMLVNGKAQTWGNIPFDPQANEAGEFYLQGIFRIL